MSGLQLSPATRALLDAARNDGPVAVSRSRIWSGVASTAGIGVAATTTSIAAGAGAGASASKLIAIGALLGSAITVGLALALLRVTHPSAPLTLPPVASHSEVANSGTKSGTNSGTNSGANASSSGSALGRGQEADGLGRVRVQEEASQAAMVAPLVLMAGAPTIAAPSEGSGVGPRTGGQESSVSSASFARSGSRASAGTAVGLNAGLPGGPSSENPAVAGSSGPQRAAGASLPAGATATGPSSVSAQGGARGGQAAGAGDWKGHRKGVRTDGSPAPAPAPSAEDSLMREVALVAEARGALVRGDALGALRTIRATANVSQRELEPEEMSIEARALRAMGHNDEADAVDVALRARYPDHALSR